MSDPAFTVTHMRLPHAWHRVRDAAHVTVRWVDDLPVPGRAKHSTQEIFIRTGMSQSKRRAVAVHELEHLEGGPAIRGYVADDEKATAQRAARWLIPIEALGDALVWATDDLELAEELWVDVATVRARLAGLTGAEDAYLNARMDAAERTFPVDLG